MSWQPLSLPDAEIAYQPDFLSQAEADQLLSDLSNNLAWRQDEIHLFGRWVKIPRLQAWYGEHQSHYRYSGLDLSPLPFPPVLAHLKERIEEACLVQFNAVLANFYRQGNDSMGWHADNEKELGPNPVIASLSLGAARRFQLKHRSRKDLQTELELAHGSLLLMSGATQHHWLHGIPKQKRISEPRINLTFRRIIGNEPNT